MLKNEGKMKKKRDKGKKKRIKGKKKKIKKFDRKTYNANIRKNRNDIEKGITKEELFQHYWQNERIAFCKENNINPKGKTTILVNRIHEWVNDSNQNGYTLPKSLRMKLGRPTKRMMEKKFESNL